MERFDVAVVGGGTAAFEAAAAAQDNGAERIIMLEKAPETESGGNARYTGTGFRFVHAGASEIREFIPQVPESEFRQMDIPPYTEQDFTSDLMNVTEGKIDPNLANVLVQDSNEAMHWLLNTGIRFYPCAGRVVDGVRYFERGCFLHIMTDGVGIGEQLRMWRKVAADRNFEIRYDSQVTHLLGSSSDVHGLRIESHQGNYEIEADATILCAGGFQANQRERAAYLGRNSDLLKVRGSRHDTGEVLMRALALGAKPAGHWSGAHITPIGADSPPYEGEGFTRYSYAFGITVNGLGERFFDEGEAEIVHTYAKTGQLMFQQPGAIAYQIFDQRLIPMMFSGWGRSYRAAKYHKGDTISDLAREIGIPPELLENTVREFNAATQDDIEFNPARQDGKSTVGITPRKSNWATPIDSPPFVAYPVTGGITFTFGGLTVNENAQVMNTRNEPIKGLYASGDIMGLFFHNYPAFSGQTRNVVFSRRAARHATGNAD